MSLFTQKFSENITKLKNNRIVPTLFSLAAVLTYLVQAFYYSHHLDLTMDEGTYLMKGLLFTKGIYKPFQPFGPWTQKNPLAYFIPGTAEVLFGPGLRTGRYLSIFFGILFLLAIWLFAKKIGNRWQATFILWIISLNSANIMNYSQAITQVIIAAMIAWAFVFLLEDQKKVFYSCLAALSGALIFLTRQNMLPVIFIILAYVFWKNGKKAFLWAAGTSFSLLLIVHLIYWPDIFSIWTFLPQSLTPFLNQWRVPEGVTGVWNPSASLHTSLSAFMEAVRYNFFAISAFVIGWLLFLGNKKRKEMKFYKEFLTLSTLFSILFVLHLYASFKLNYGVFTFSRYLSFFSFTAYLIGQIAFPLFKENASKIVSIFSGLYFVLMAGALGFGAYKELGLFLTIQVPRIKNNQFLPGKTDLWRLLANKFGLSFDFLQVFLPTVFCFLIGILLVILILGIKKICKLKKNISYLLITVFFFISFILTPTRILGGGNYEVLCDNDIIQSNESVGNYINEIVPEDSQIFWYSNNSPVPLLYLKNINIYPAQLDQSFNFYLDGDPTEIEKLGFWNRALFDKWKNEADFLLITDDYVLDFVNDENFLLAHQEIAPLPTTIGCRDKSIIHIFMKKNGSLD